MVSYEFYKDTYLGSSIPESAFPGLILRAQVWMDKLERCCQVVPYGPDSRAMALCAAAETLHVWSGRKDVAQTTVGAVQVRYEKSDLGLQRQLLQSVSGYLEIHRGVG